jgi:hypothetical protein
LYFLSHLLYLVPKSARKKRTKSSKKGPCIDFTIKETQVSCHKQLVDSLTLALHIIAYNDARDDIQDKK